MFSGSFSFSQGEGPDSALLMSKDPITISFLRDHRSLIPHIADCHHQEWFHLDRSYTLDHRIGDLCRHAVPDSLPIGLVACRNGELVGTVSLVEREFGNLFTCGPWLSNLYVEKRFRKCGYGSLLVTSLCELARSRGFSTLYLASESAETFYERLGWKSQQSIDFGGRKHVIMSKTLNETGL